MATQDVTPDRLGRCTFLLCSEDGTPCGTGVLLDAHRMLTCAHVVEGLARVGVYDGVPPQPLSLATVTKRGNPKGADDLALLLLDKPLDGRGGLSFVGWERDERFSVTGFPAHGRDHVSGRVQGTSRFGWLQIGVESGRQIEPGYSGSGVWSSGQKAAIGIVTHFDDDGDGVAYIVPKEVIAPFIAPKIPAAVDLSPNLPNIGLNRWLRIVDAESQRSLGSGFRLTSTQVLTAWEVARSSDGLAVVDEEALRLGVPRGACWVGPEDPTQAYPVVLLELTSPPDTIERFVLPERPTVPSGSRWKTLAQGSEPGELLALGGTASPLDGGSWQVESLQASPDGLDDISPFLGGAVFVEVTDGAPSPSKPTAWVLLGVLGWRRGASEQEAEAATLPPLEIRSLDDVRRRPDLGGDATVRPSTSPHIQRVTRLLRRGPSAESVHKALRGHDPDGPWAWAATQGDDALAVALCHGTEPASLVESFFEVFCDFVDAKGQAEAEHAFDLLMQALPAALNHRWPTLPDAAATDVRLGLGTILVDFALAALEGGQAEFFLQPPKGTDVPRPTHQVTDEVGEKGFDPEVRDVITAVVGEVVDRLGKTPEAESLGRLVGLLAVQPSGGDGLRWLDPEVLRDEGQHRQRGRLLQLINQELAMATRAKRRFYYLATKAEDPVVAGLKKVLPKLKIVTLEGSHLKPDRYDHLRSFLIKLFNYRGKLKDSKP